MKKNTFGVWVIIGAIVATISLFTGGNRQASPAADVSASATSSTDATGDPSPEPSATQSAAPLPYWPTGLDVEDVTYTDANNRDCTFDLCMFVKLTALKACSSVTLDGETYDAYDEVVDDFSQDFGAMKKGAVRIVELGTDSIDDTEEYVDLYDSTCYK